MKRLFSDGGPAQTETVETWHVDIFMAGDIAQAKQIAREFCYENGFCVTIEPCLYIYSGGEEEGFRVGIMDYPRFPLGKVELNDRAYVLAGLLRYRLRQASFTMTTPEETVWYSWVLADNRSTAEQNKEPKK